MGTLSPYMAAAISGLSLLAGAPSYAGEPQKSTQESAQNQPQSTPPRISLEQFEQQKAAFGMPADVTGKAPRPKAEKDINRVYKPDALLIPEPVYNLTEQSEAFIGPRKVDQKGFIAYQDSALTPEGRTVEPMESLASVGIRSKF